MNKDVGKRIVALCDRIAEKFDRGHWQEIGLLTGHSREINTYPRLLRSLDWGDDDYRGNVLGVLRQIVEKDPNALSALEQYAEERFDGSEFISSKPSERRITFAPQVFSVPDDPPQQDLVAVMMPLASEFGAVYKAIRRACADVGMSCARADDIWEDSVIIQDIFSLIFRARLVIVDFSRKNPNVMYETGIAHTLGKDVVPISQSLDDVPFDLKHHRVLPYLPNSEGLKTLQEKLAARLRQITHVQEEQSFEDDEVPF